MKALEKIKQKFKTSKFAKWATAGAVTGAVAAMSCMSVFAADPETSATAEETIQSSLTTAFGGMSDTILNYVAVTLPVALGVVCVIVAVNFAIRFFMSIIRK